MGDHDDSHAELGLQLAQESKDRFAGGGIQIAGGLVGEKNLRAIDESAGDGHALLLAAGEFGGAVAKTMCEANALEGFADTRWALGPIHFGEAKWEFDILFEGHAREEVERLEDHADGVAAIAGEFYRGKSRDVLTMRGDRTGCGAIQAGDEIEERGFAGAGGAEECEELVVGNGERKFVDRADGSFAHGVVAGDAIELDSGIGDGHGMGVN